MDCHCPPISLYDADDSPYLCDLENVTTVPMELLDSIMPKRRVTQAQLNQVKKAL